MSKEKEIAGNKYQEYQFPEILDRISDGFVALDNNWRYTYLNKAAGIILGRNPEEMIGKNLWEEFPALKEEPLEVYHAYMKAMEEGKSVSIENYYKPFDTWFVTQLYPSSGGVTIYFRDITDRKKKENKIKELQFKMDAAIRIGKIGIWEWDIPNDEVYWNDYMYELYQIEKGLPLNYDSVLSRVHPDDMVFHKQLVEARIKNKDNAPFDYRVQRPDGNVRYVKVFMEVLDNEKGEAIKFRGTVLDITEQKLAEKKVMEQENLLRLFIHYSPVALVMLDKDMKYMEASKQWLQDYSIKNKNLIGESHYKIFPEIPEHWKEIHQRCLAGETAKKDEEIFVRADGTKEWIRWEVHPWYKNSDEVGGIIIFSENITERKKAEGILAERENRLRTILETEPECVKQLNQLGEVIDMNPAGLAMIEAENLEMIQGKSVLGIINEPYKKAFSALTKNIFQGKTGTLEFEITGLKGAKRWLETHAVPLKDAAGNIVSLLGVTRDITNRKNAEEQVQKLNNELEQKIKERTAELEQANKDLEEINDLFVGRESRIIELKEELEAIKNKK